MQNTAETKAFFDRLAPTWDQNCRHDAQKLAAIVTLAGIRSGMRVIDIGCGTGVLFKELLSRGVAELWGVDLSDRMIGVAKRKYSDSRLRLIAGDLFDVTADGFDAATLYSAYPHFPDKERLAQKAARLLVPGGRLTVAHSESREAINARHGGPEVSRLSDDLRPAECEAAHFKKYFDMDVLIDTQDLYVISGTRI